MKTIFFVITLSVLCIVIPNTIAAQWHAEPLPMHHIVVVDVDSKKLVPLYQYVFGEYIKGLKEGDYLTVIFARPDGAHLEMSQHINDCTASARTRIKQVFNVIDEVRRY